jgi:hypothetical protein
LGFFEDTPHWPVSEFTAITRRIQAQTEHVYVLSPRFFLPCFAQDRTAPVEARREMVGAH